MRVLSICLGFLATAVAGPALAHTGPELAHIGVAGGLWSGLLHPLLGLDHLVAMVAVGLWASQLGRPAIWILPACFMALMALGGLLGMTGVQLPGTEWVIAISAVVLGLAVAMGARAPAWAAAAIVGLFAVFHGHAHGAEMPGSANALAYGVGFVAATGLLHGTGIMAGMLARWPAGARTVRAMGAAVAGLGATVLLTQPL